MGQYAVFLQYIYSIFIFFSLYTFKKEKTCYVIFPSVYEANNMCFIAIATSCAPQQKRHGRYKDHVGTSCGRSKDGVRTLCTRFYWRSGYFRGILRRPHSALTCFQNTVEMLWHRRFV